MPLSEMTAESSADTPSTTKPHFHRIGAGQCGSVYAPARPGPACALKREDGATIRSVGNDYNMHRRILSGFVQLRAHSASPDTVNAGGSSSQVFAASLTIPACHALIQADDDKWWTDERIQRFPEATRQQRARILITERIPSFPVSVMELLVHEFCVPTIQDKILPSLPGEHCIMRAYLGRRRRVNGMARGSLSRFRGFSLRNYPLCVDDMERWGLPVESYAETMADTLARILWVAGCDAEDVEFVLAPPRELEKEGLPAGTTTPYSSTTIGSHTLWLLDFDRVQLMEKSEEENLTKAADAFWRNDPYYPRPGRADQRDQLLWSVFRHRFLITSKSMDGHGQDPGKLALKLMNKIESMAQLRA